MAEWILETKKYLKSPQGVAMMVVTLTVTILITLGAGFFGTSNKDVESQLASVVTINSEKVRDRIGEVHNIDCSILEKNWIPSSKDFINNHSFYLVSSKESGSAAFSQEFSRFYNINIHLLPRVETSLNTVISVKDRQENELSFVIGDQDDRSARVSYKQNGNNVELPSFGRKQVVPAIDTTQNINIVISVGWSTDQVRVASHFEYTPKGKEKTTWFTLLDTKISKGRISDPVSLNVGIRNPDGTEREVKIMECSISPEDETLR